MPVTFQVASHKANSFELDKSYTPSVDNILEESCRPQWRRCKEILQSSLEADEVLTMVPYSNGFVHAVLDAYGAHRHLRIRPDDVWLAIVVQLNFYINAHAEELRSYFVAHEGKKKLVLQAAGDRYAVDYGSLAQTFTKRIHENVVDDTLVKWILPDFTTTTTRDTTVCSIVIMASLKEYFEYVIDCICGIPSVTLEGEKSDWVEIYRRLERLYDFGKEPSVWAEMLRPILRRFISAFDGEPDVEFWSHVAYHHSEMCGREDLSGWITAFCVWSHKGEWNSVSLPESTPVKPSFVLIDSESRRKRLSKIIPRFLRRNAKSPGRSEEDSAQEANDKPSGSVMIRHSWRRGNPTYTLDNVPFSVLDATMIPPGYCEVDVTVNDNGVKLECMMVAGHVAYSTSSTAGNEKMDTVRPSAQWFMFERT
ncbi:hypothetical protein BD309DRAFT_897067 [Dichomitus squalens]|uniref:DUF4419 domain-containing protein n=1 Tax=Dichomitus squalens TaxID=114155 RepID=A0A4Q9NPZ2_9APHY|nr:hypothetical protein BD311DRAFT_732980 [Dichomitus squalens]TBU42032.1 hypothetical protein BD309DRAFT_897067 [Dichomitus squalens]TBU60381.1 hypothetical protein BD310DRAFT_922852 [Dichomitus squalens]